MEYFMLYLGVCSVLFCFIVYRVKVEECTVTIRDLVVIITVSYTPLVNLFFIYSILNIYDVLNKKVL